MVVAAGLGLAACHRTALTHDGASPDAGTDGNAPSAPSADGGFEVGVAPPDAGTDAADPAVELHQLVGSLNDAFYGRWSSCFDTPRALWPTGDFTDLPLDSLQDSVRLGLLRIDPEAMKRCLDTLATAPCERLADISIHGPPIGRGNVVVPECSGMLVGQVSPGKPCRINEECQSPEAYACVGNRVCGRVCTARLARATGEACSDMTDQCPTGTVCRFGPDNVHEQRCLTPTTQGGVCREDAECASGLLCAQSTATSVFAGTCRPLALGSPCAGNWQCAYSYVCAGDGPNHPGTCQVGKPVGATCTTYLQDVNQNLYSDCAPATFCLDLDGTGPRCVDGAALGERCGTQTGPYSGWVGCLEGYCDRDPGSAPTVGTCAPTKSAGASCESDVECTSPNRCLSVLDGHGWCGLPNAPAALGSRCSFGIESCGAGEYCALPASYDPQGPSVPSFGSCALAIPAGQPCRAYVDLCASWAECVDGVCKPCQ